jgi:hypothetical protein
VEKVWRWDAEKQIWDPEKVDTNVGIPVFYRIKNKAESGLGHAALRGGKVRVYQKDGHGGTIVLGEDRVPMIPVGEDMEVYIGDSRDIVVTQRKVKNRKINVRRNDDHRIVLYDTDEMIKTKIENFKKLKARLTMVQHIPGHWDMEECNMPYVKKDAYTLEFDIELPPNDRRELIMHFHRRNVR